MLTRENPVIACASDTSVPPTIIIPRENLQSCALDESQLVRLRRECELATFQLLMVEKWRGVSACDW